MWKIDSKLWCFWRLEFMVSKEELFTLYPSLLFKFLIIYLINKKRKKKGFLYKMIEINL